MGRHGETAVAADRHAYTVRRGELGAEDAADTETHRRKAPGVEHGLRLCCFPELHVPIVVHAAVEGNDGIIRQRGACFLDYALGP